MGGYVLLVPPVWGRGTLGVVLGVAQNGTVGCEKSYISWVSNHSHHCNGFIPKVLEAGWDDA